MRRLVVLLLLASASRAGGGPETTVVVVNARSPVSHIVANEYIKLRDIPRTNVVYLKSVPHLGVITLDEFKTLIWRPIKEHIELHCTEIRLITYSADFPYGVRFQKKFENKQKRMMVGGIASLNGVTYLNDRLDEKFWNLTINPYYGIVTGRPKRATSAETAHHQRAVTALNQKDYRGAAASFRKLLETYDGAPQPWYNYACCLARLKRGDDAIEALRKAVAAGWGDAGHTAQDPDLASLRKREDFRTLLKSMGGKVKPSRAFDIDGAYLSTHLGYTGRYGNSLSEVLDCLRRTAAADGTRPDGTVYFLRNKNVRSGAREGFVGLLQEGLRARGRKFELLDGVLPKDRADVLGAVIGTAKFDWTKCGSRILPGAIVEHLTSFGAHFGTAGQTKLSEFIRYGAAGASGTVMEPLSMHQKFPNPVIHLFYADGCSLAEAFYQSVHGPYQLMIVGDGLARPFTKFREVAMRGGNPHCKGAKRFEYWVDGKRVEGLPMGSRSGDVRVVAIHDPVDTRSYIKISDDETPPPSDNVLEGTVGALDRKKPDRLNPGLRGSVDGKPALVADLTRLRGTSTLEGWFHLPQPGLYQFVVFGKGAISISVSGRELCQNSPALPALFVATRFEQGWHRLEIESAGALELLLGGDRVLAPLTVHAAARRLHKRQPTFVGDLKSGLTVTWKRAAAGIVALSIRGKRGSAKSFTVESALGRKFKPVKDFTVLNAGRFVEIAFKKPVRAKSFRIRAEGDFVVTTVEANR